MRLLILNIFILLVACSGAGKISRSEQSNLEITLNKSACYGKCPAYQLSIKQDTAWLDATANTSLIGQYYTVITNIELDTLYGLLDQSDLFKSKEDESYDQEITDAPLCKLIVKCDNKSKTIKFRQESPKKIKQLELYLENMMKELHRWESEK